MKKGTGVIFGAACERGLKKQAQKRPFLASVFRIGFGTENRARAGFCRGFFDAAAVLAI